MGKRSRSVSPPTPETIKEISTGELIFDPENPRFYRLHDPTDLEVVTEMLDEEGVQDLMSSIGQQGYFPGEPLLVVPSGKKFTVIEGNRRLAAVKLLNGELRAPANRDRSVTLLRKEAKVSPTSLPCLVYSDRRDILRYLGYRHITGVQEWDALSKAKYLAELRDTFYKALPKKDQLKTIAREIGSRADVVGQLLTALTIYQRADAKAFFRKHQIDAEAIDFSYISTALSYTSITEWLGLSDRTDLDAKKLRDDRVILLFKWMFVQQKNGSTILGETRRFHMLAAIVESLDAISALNKSGNLDEAFLYTSGPEEAVSTAMERAGTSLRVVWDILLKGKLVAVHASMGEELVELAKKVLAQIQAGLKTGR